MRSDGDGASEGPGQPGGAAHTPLASSDKGLLWRCWLALLPTATAPGGDWLRNVIDHGVQPGKRPSATQSNYLTTIKIGAWSARRLPPLPPPPPPRRPIGP
mmetsp:Transcript_16993/g.51416  ORF Transcript_16993/g.51416 Transcript_16993/m.51416 type:complete len:101 (-) Transcript_16993:434-736(-)